MGSDRINVLPAIAAALVVVVVQGLGCTCFGQSASADVPVGWASVEGGTTGGKNGTAITVRDAERFSHAVKGDQPVIVQVAGTIKLADKVQIGSNKTVIGLATDATITGNTVNMKNVHNIIISNLTFRDSNDDAINIESNSHHIWIDHCDLSRAKDGLIDIKKGSDLITVSWNHLHDHHKTCLLGHSDKTEALSVDRGRLRVTYHHNFLDGTQTRHPRVRIAEPVHVFNNYFFNNEYGVASTDDAGVLVEGNYFERVKNPTYSEYGDSKAPGRLVERNNDFVGSGPPSARGEVKEPRDFYKYTLDAPQQVAELVRRGAGVRR
jgi:pectate lyase